MNRFKKLGKKVKATTFEKQVVKLDVRATTFKRFTQLGYPNTVAVG